jgi:serine/threonine protein kinase
MTARQLPGGYEIIRVLGEGSSGRTLLCTGAGGGSQVAVKELRFEHLENWKNLELFQREAELLALLDHRGIPRVLDSFRGEDESTSLYIVQEFIEGSSLQERMTSGPMLGQHEVQQVAIELLEVLEYLHGRSPPVLHRDIKPSNVLIRPGGDAALVDFGGATLGWQLPGQAGATVVGTFGYMPPEQLIGQAGPTSDLYALGATLLHVVTGRSPDEFPFDSGRIEVPSDLPADPGLARLIEALLRPAPRDRPQTAAAARQLLTSAPVATASTAVTTGEPTRVPAVRRHAAVASGEGPRFVDLGPPPRDPEGEFKDVFSNLVNPLFPARRLWSAGNHVAWVVLAGLASVVSLGSAPVAYLLKVRNRKHQYAELFKTGECAHGVIVSAKEANLFAIFRYEFEIGGEVYGAFMQYAQEMTGYWGEGDTVPVLYDPNDPRHSCFVYR